MMNNNELLAEIKKFNRNVEWLKKKEIQKTSKWVRASVILKKTGWTRSELETARRNSYIIFKQSGKSTMYDPETINKEYLTITQTRHGSFQQESFRA